MGNNKPLLLNLLPPAPLNHDQNQMEPTSRSVRARAAWLWKTERLGLASVPRMGYTGDGTAERPNNPGSSNHRKSPHPQAEENKGGGQGRTAGQSQSHAG